MPTVTGTATLTNFQYQSIEIQHAINSYQTAIVTFFDKSLANETVHRANVGKSLIIDDDVLTQRFFYGEIREIIYNTGTWEVRYICEGFAIKALRTRAAYNPVLAQYTVRHLEHDASPTNRTILKDKDASFGSWVGKFAVFSQQGDLTKRVYTPDSSSNALYETGIESHHSHLISVSTGGYAGGSDNVSNDNSVLYYNDGSLGGSNEYTAYKEDNGNQVNGTGHRFQLAKKHGTNITKIVLRWRGYFDKLSYIDWLDQTAKDPAFYLKYQGADAGHIGDWEQIYQISKSDVGGTRSNSAGTDNNGNGQERTPTIDIEITIDDSNPSVGVLTDYLETKTTSAASDEFSTYELNVLVAAGKPPNVTDDSILSTLFMQITVYYDGSQQAEQEYFYIDVANSTSLEFYGAAGFEDRHPIQDGIANGDLMLITDSTLDVHTALISASGIGWFTSRAISDDENRFTLTDFTNKTVWDWLQEYCRINNAYWWAQHVSGTPTVYIYDVAGAPDGSPYSGGSVNLTPTYASYNYSQDGWVIIQDVRNWRDSTRLIGNNVAYSISHGVDLALGAEEDLERTDQLTIRELIQLSAHSSALKTGTHWTVIMKVDLADQGATVWQQFMLGRKTTIQIEGITLTNMILSNIIYNWNEQTAWKEILTLTWKRRL